MYRFSNVRLALALGVNYALVAAARFISLFAIDCRAKAFLFYIIVCEGKCKTRFSTGANLPGYDLFSMIIESMSR